MASPIKQSPDKPYVRVLICSANMGNAKPDAKSIEEWLPLDGLCRHAMPPRGMRPEFPIVMDPRRAKNPPLPLLEQQPEATELALSPEAEMECQEFENMFYGQRLQASASGDSAAPAPTTAGAVESSVSTMDADNIPAMVSPTTKRDSMDAAFDNNVFEAFGGGGWGDAAFSPQPKASTRNLGGLENAFPATPFGALDSEPPPGQINLLDGSSRSGMLDASTRSSVSLPFVAEDETQFDIIVIGMQEATFNMEDAANKCDDADANGEEGNPDEDDKIDEEGNENDDEESISSSSSDGAEEGGQSDNEGLPVVEEKDTTNTSDEEPASSSTKSSGKKSKTKMLTGALSKIGKTVTKSSSRSSEEEERGGAQSDDEDLLIVEEDTATTATSSTITSDGEPSRSRSRPDSGKKSKTKMLSGALSKIGKAAAKSTITAVKVTSKVSAAVAKEGVKVTNKVGKATVQNAKTAKTLVTERDNTDRPVPTPQQISNLEEEIVTWSDTTVLHYMFEEQLPSYKRALSYQLGEMRLVIYYQEKAIDLDLLSVKSEATGKHGLANKGGIVAEVAVNETTRLGFLTAHLEAHEGAEHCAARCASFKDIFCGTRSSHAPFKYDASSTSHFTFVLGDLNFRTKLNPGYGYGTERHIAMCHALAARKNWMALNKYDELQKVLREKKCLLGFATPYCNFDPTFKVARKEGYEYNIKRSPSFTDRILFKTTEQLQSSLRPLIYEPIRAFTTSDHKPIRGAFDIKLNESLVLGAQQDDDTGLTQPQGRLHFLVSSMRCQLDRELYDKQRGTEREMPHPYLAFVSTPAEALQMEASKSSPTKRRGSSKKGKFPETSVVSEAFKPNWRDEQLYFQLQIQDSNESPIDFAGALMHVSVFDKRGGDRVLLGAIALNLAKLIDNAKQGPNRRLPMTPGSGRGFAPMNLGSGRAGRGAPGRHGGSGRGPQMQPPPGRGGQSPPHCGPGRGRGMQDHGASGRAVARQNSGRGVIRQGSGRGVMRQGSGRGAGSGRGFPQAPVGRGVPRQRSGGPIPQAPAGRGVPRQRSGSAVPPQTAGRGMPQQNPGRGAPTRQGSGRGGPLAEGAGRVRGGPRNKRKSTEGRIQGANPTGSSRRMATLGAAAPSTGGPAAGGRGTGRGPAPVPGRGQIPSGSGPEGSGRRPRSNSPKRSRSPSPVPRGRPRTGMGAWAFGKPSKALQTAYQKEGMPKAVTKASKALKKMKKEGGGGAVGTKGKDIHVISLHWSEEPLLDGASEIGRITLSIDAWWMNDSDLTSQKEAPPLPESSA